jgi:hypothetical protein
MRRFYSSVLLLALMSTPLTAIGAALFSGSVSCCCSSTICPMHKKAQPLGQRGKLCGGNSAPMQQCCRGMSNCNQELDLGILTIASQAVIGHDVTISAPQRTQEFARLFLLLNLSAQ